MQIKTTISYHFTPARMAVIKKMGISCSKDVVKREHLVSLGGKISCVVTVVPQKIKNIN